VARFWVKKIYEAVDLYVGAYLNHVFGVVLGVFLIFSFLGLAALGNMYLALDLVASTFYSKSRLAMSNQSIGRLLGQLIPSTPR
jgi:hypothetical protein